MIKKVEFDDVCYCGDCDYCRKKDNEIYEYIFNEMVNGAIEEAYEDMS